MIKGRLHSIETLGSLDGPGLRTVFFLQGCNMKCIYCHNRDTWSVSGGKEYTVDDVVSTALSYREYYGEDGGVTFSGGEPLLQSDFLIEAAEALMKENIHTALDTSGSFFSEKTRELFGLADLIILDIKHSRKKEYERLCAYPGDNVFSNLEYLQKSDRRYWVRQVIVEGYTDDPAQVENLKTLLQTGNRPEKTELLPYHNMGREKWTACGQDYSLEGVKPPSEARMEQLKAVLSP